MKTFPSKVRKAMVIGGGPAGLMAAEVLLSAGVQVDLFDAMPSAGRKFLMAGRGGLNLTHSEPAEKFLCRYGAHRAHIEPLISDFGPDAVRSWVHDLGIETFVGTSGRVFPTEMKAAPLLRAWLRRLRAAGLNMHMRHRWQGWESASPNAMRFSTPGGPLTVEAEAVVLALGGGSWPKLGSDGAWLEALEGAGVPLAPLQPSNCGFDVGWSDYFRTKFAGQPVKSVRAGLASCDLRKGEFMITKTGVEGGLIYALSAPARDAISAARPAMLYIDLAPARDLNQLTRDLSRPRGKNSLANYLRKYAGLDGVKAGLLREVLTLDDFENHGRLAGTIKALPLALRAPRPLAEAISTAGGVMFEGLDDALMLRKLPGVFCAGEMLDWEAPTGGYLLTACFASGRRAGQGALNWLESRL
jgi:uncharacterized flavoprotein (TIGR03862 family)